MIAVIASHPIAEIEWRGTSHKYNMHIISIYRSIPESVVSPGIALAISAMAFPSCCIGVAVGADVGINVGAGIA